MASQLSWDRVCPGVPSPNAHAESFIAQLHDEYLAVEVFHTLRQVKIMAASTGRSASRTHEVQSAVPDLIRVCTAVAQHQSWTQGGSWLTSRGRVNKPTSPATWTSRRHLFANPDRSFPHAWSLEAGERICFGLQQL